MEVDLGAVLFVAKCGFACIVIAAVIIAVGACAGAGKQSRMEERLMSAARQEDKVA